MTTNKMAFFPDPTSFPGTHTPSCPQPSACVVPDGSRSPSAAFPLPFLLLRNNGKVKRNEDYKQDGCRGAYNLTSSRSHEGIGIFQVVRVPGRRL